MSVLKFKRGSSFTFTGQITVNGAVIDMTGWLIRSAIRVFTDNGNLQGGIGALIATLPSTWLNPILAIAQVGDNSVNTGVWPLGLALIDIELTAPSGAIVMSDSQRILIAERVTQ